MIYISYMKIIIVYNIYIDNNVNKNWKYIVLGQLKDLKKSNILKSIKYINFTITANNKKYMRRCVNLLKSYFIYSKLIKNQYIKFHITKKYINKYEYYSIYNVYKLALKNQNDIILYFHTKGMSHNRKRINIEKLLTKSILNPDNIINFFIEHDNINKVGLFPSNGGFIWFNFWYVRCSYINKIECPIESDNRWYYEGWLANYKPNVDVNVNDCYSLFKNNNQLFTGEETNNYIKNLNKYLTIYKINKHY